MTFDEVKTDMEFLGTYKKEFDTVINIYIDIYRQYEEAWKEFEADGMKATINCTGGKKKNPTVIALEDLRKQFVTFSDRLGLNPKALDQIKNAQVTQEKTPLEKFISEFNGKTDRRDGAVRQ